VVFLRCPFWLLGNAKASILGMGNRQDSHAFLF